MKDYGVVYLVDKRFEYYISYLAKWANITKNLIDFQEAKDEFTEFFSMKRQEKEK